MGFCFQRKRSKVLKRQQERNAASVKFKNDNKRLQEEWEDLIIENKALRDAVEKVAEYSIKKFRKSLTITMIFRTDEEQAEIYKDNPRYKRKPFKSPHQFWHAVDLRSRDFSKSQIQQLVDEFNRLNSKNYYSWTAECHDVGKGLHFHVQYVSK